MEQMGPVTVAIRPLLALKFLFFVGGRGGFGVWYIQCLEQMDRKIDGANIEKICNAISGV